MLLHGEHAATGSALRRRQRRLRQWHRHERMTVAMALAEARHHTTPRGPKTARAQEEVERETYNVPRHQNTPPLGTLRVRRERRHASLQEWLFSATDVPAHVTFLWRHGASSPASSIISKTNNKQPQQPQRPPPQQPHQQQHQDSDPWIVGWCLDEHQRLEIFLGDEHAEVARGVVDQFVRWYTGGVFRPRTNESDWCRHIFREQQH